MRSRLMLVLLLFLVPLQGLAAAARTLCATDGSAPNGYVSTAHAVHAAHGHGPAAAAAVAGVADTGESGPDGSHEGCAHCAACVVGAGLVGTASAFTVVAADSAPFLHGHAAPRRRPFEGPERPPRTV